MALNLVIPFYLTLQGDGSSTVFSYAISNLYQLGTAGTIPFGASGVVPSSIVAVNPHVPVTSVTVDVDGNITLTLASALGAGISLEFQLNLSFASGAAISASPIQSQPVTGTFWQATQPISAATLPLSTGAATAVKQPALGTAGSPSADVISIQGEVGMIPVVSSLGNTTGKTNVLKTGSLTTTATTVDQVVLTYTVTAGKTFYLQYVKLASHLTVFPGNGNPILMGNISLETPSGTKVYTVSMSYNNVTNDLLPLSEPIPITGGTVIRVVVTPAVATSMLWIANLGGYEK